MRVQSPGLSTRHSPELSKGGVSMEKLFSYIGLLHVCFPAFRKLMQEDHEFKASLGYIGLICKW